MIREEIKVGKILTTESNRDAIHVAVAPVIAGTNLRPGDKIGFVDKENNIVSRKGKIIGIVDPFLTGRVERGQKFYLFLFPNTITSLNHNWTHPEFEDNDNSGVVLDTLHTMTEEYRDAKHWLERYAEAVELSYFELLDAMQEYQETGKEASFSMNQSNSTMGFGNDILWRNYEIVTGMKAEKVDDFYSCDCY